MSKMRTSSWRRIVAGITIMYCLFLCATAGRSDSVLLAEWAPLMMESCAVVQDTERMAMTITEPAKVREVNDTISLSLSNERENSIAGLSHYFETDVEAAGMDVHFCTIQPKNESENREKVNNASSWSDSTVKWLSSMVQKVSFVAAAIYAVYDAGLNEFTLMTKMLSAAVVALLGDILAQTIERRALLQMPRRFLDISRLFSVAVESMFVSGPILHYAYEWMETFLHGMPSVIMVAIDVFVLDSFFVFTMMVTSAILEGRIKSIPDEIKNNYLPSAQVAWSQSLAMGPLQMMNFGLIPLRFRVLITNLQDVVWNAGVSFMVHKARS